ncbi:hypothetical protein [Arthrobacter sp. ISL-5]|uniref:hypothetical protein n=1 Tax=Arthrobacter sp. ISL-5 TaxID=2819111 RepID=UPI001BE98F8A|nr:hypothetical protein [Arthrobacter sp. ISL-5]MBT2551927.1 hypothetical protein [Arthrobacter sp. ISL-5]
MNITYSKLTRAAGLSAVLSGLLFILIQPIHPLEDAATVTSPAWAIVAYMTMAMSILGLVGLSGIYLRQVKETGLVGLIGYLMFAFEYVLVAAWTFAEALILPPLAAEAPQFVDSFLSIFNGSGAGISLGTLGAMGLVSFVFYLGGGVLSGIAIFRAGVLSRRGALLLALGAGATPLVALLPHALGRYAAVPVGLALIWLGYSLWSEQRKSSREPTTAVQNTHLNRTPVV